MRVVCEDVGRAKILLNKRNMMSFYLRQSAQNSRDIPTDTIGISDMYAGRWLGSPVGRVGHSSGGANFGCQQ